MPGWALTACRLPGGGGDRPRDPEALAGLLEALALPLLGLLPVPPARRRPRLAPGTPAPVRTALPEKVGHSMAPGPAGLPPQGAAVQAQPPGPPGMPQPPPGAPPAGVPPGAPPVGMMPPGGAPPGTSSWSGRSAAAHRTDERPAAGAAAGQPASRA